MLQKTRKTWGLKKIMVYKIPPGGGGKPYLASGLKISVFKKYVWLSLVKIHPVWKNILKLHIQFMI